MKIEVLYPEVCNLYGDLQNIEYLKRCCPSLEICNTSLKSERPLFLDEEIALVYMGSTTEQGLKLASDLLRPLKSEILAKITEGQRILLTGNALDIWGEYIDSDQDARIEGIGILPTHAEYHMMKRHNSFYLGKFADMEIVGFKSLFGHTYSHSNDNPFFTTVRGIGRNPATSPEGFRIHNLYATYLIGPLFLLNPPLCQYFLRDMGLDDTLAYQEAAMNSYHKRVAEFHEENRSFLY